MAKWIFIGLGALVLLVAIYAGLAFSSLGVRWGIAPFRGAVEEREITNRGQYRIQAYEQFYRWQEEVEGIDVKLGSYPEELDRRQATECRGLLARRVNIVAQYNSASRAERTQGQWQAPELPRNLNQENLRSC